MLQVFTFLQKMSLMLHLLYTVTVPLNLCIKTWLYALLLCNQCTLQRVHIFCVKLWFKEVITLLTKYSLVKRRYFVLLFILKVTCNKVAKAVKQCSIHYLSVELWIRRLNTVWWVREHETRSNREFCLFVISSYTKSYKVSISAFASTITRIHKGWIHLQHTRVAVPFAHWNFLSFLSLKTIKNSSGQMRQKKKKLYLRVCWNESTQSFSRCPYIKVSPRLQISRCIFMVKLPMHDT